MKLELKEIEYECVDWIYVTQDRVPPSSRTDTVINLVVV